MVTLKKGKGFFSFLVLLSVFFVAVGGVVFQTPSIAQESDESRLAEISELNRIIQETGARWVAGETPFSRLSLEEKKKWLGLVKPEMEMMQLAEEDLIFQGELPLALSLSLDWRNNGGNFVTPVRNQGGCGSCWAFATTGALESYNLIRNNTPGTDLNLSEQVMVSCGTSGGHDAGGCGGGYIQYASDYIRNTGLPLETCYPYTNPPNDGNCANACANWEPSAYKITKWSYAGYPYGTVATVEGLKAALTTYGPLVTTMDVYEDFYDYRSGVYSYVSGGYLGGHAVLLVGYDDPGQYFIVKNSWGTGYWGESGYFRIAYSEMDSVVDFGEWTIAYGDPIPSNPETVSAPTSLSGTTCGTTNTSYSYSTGGSTSSSGHSVQYRFDWGDSTNSGWLSVGTTSASKSWSSPGTYSVTAQARCSSDTSVFSSSSTPLSVALLGTPSNVSPTSGATGISTTPTLSWTALNASSYEVYFGTASNPPFADTTASASYSFSGLSNNTKYYWKIVAKNSCGSSATGPVWSFTTACATTGTPSIPSPSNGATGVSTSLTLSWTGSNTSAYHVYFGTSPSPSYVATTAGTTYNVSGLNNNTTYYWKVVAQNSCGDLASGPVWSFTTVVGTSTVVTVTQPNGGETFPVGSTQTIRWSAPAQATKFNLAYSINNGSTWRSIASNVTGSSHIWQVPALTNSQKKCRVRVIGFDSRGVKVGEDRSDSTFTILGVRVTAPTVGATLTSGSTGSITWEKTGTDRSCWGC